VLSLLRGEFPDVTISKIRFLESQGLVDPERTPSGYRKFYEADVERLRWILLQQKEHFLPLKVIKDRLESSDPAGDPSAPMPADNVEGLLAPLELPGHPIDADHRLPPEDPRRSQVHLPSEQSDLDGAPSLKRPVDDVALGATVPSPSHPAIFAGLHRSSTDPNRSSTDPNRSAAGAQRASVGELHVGESFDSEREQLRPAEVFQNSYTEAELAAAAGCSTRLVADLTQFGLVGPLGKAGGSPYYDRCAVEICRAASRFAAFGVEPRHLRVWRNAAVKEVELFAQLVVPLLRQHNPKGRTDAEETLSELAAAGAQLRAALVEREISSIR
jgi:DNA-binding transcriptional MerR regulator